MITRKYSTIKPSDVDGRALTRYLVGIKSDEDTLPAYCIYEHGVLVTVYEYEKYYGMFL